MADIEIKHLFNYSRFPENELKILLAFAYLPIGLMLMLLRCILALFLIVFGQILPDSPVVQRFLNNLACLCFGITVSVENHKKKENVDVYISNSLSVFDHLAVHKALGLILPVNKTPLQSLPGFGIIDFGSVNNSEIFKKNLEIVTKQKKIPILLSPEDTPTNGRALLKFNSKYFQYFDKVQPLCITIKRPLLDISITTIGSAYIHDVLYYMYSPFTNYNIKFMTPMEKKSLSEDEYAEIVRQNIASELKIEATSFSSSDLAEWSKRRLAEEKRRSQERVSSQLGTMRLPNPDLTRMASQVKEVLPHVPVITIYNDLAVTRSVDATITNILEGRVRFIAESLTSQPVASSSHQPSVSSKSSRNTVSISHTSSIAHLNTGAANFAKSATERARSFQERKEQLIAAARRRYIEKHNLDIPV